MLHDPLHTRIFSHDHSTTNQNKESLADTSPKYSSNACVVKRSHVKSCIDFSHLCSFSFLPSEISHSVFSWPIEDPRWVILQSVLRLVAGRFCVVLPLRQKYHQNGAVLSSLRPLGVHDSICLFIDDVPFDRLVKVVSPRLSPVKLLLPTLQLIISLWGDILKHVNMPKLPQTWIYSLIYFSKYGLRVSFCSVSSNPLQSSPHLMLKLSLTWQVNSNSCKPAYFFF